MRVHRTPMVMALLLGAPIAMPSILYAADSRTIEEIVVTAERKISSVQDTSISITAFTAEMLDDFGIRNQSDLQNMIPATTIQPYDSAIRGVGRNFRNLGGDPGIATYMTGVYSEDLYSATIGSFWDIDRIEVLRGPQGTLYGRNAVGGAMNFLYKKPTDTFEFSAKTVLGSYGTQDGYGMISGPLIDGVLNSRFTVSQRRHDGWIEERSIGPDLDSGDELNIALQFQWTINDSTDDTDSHDKPKAPMDELSRDIDNLGFPYDPNSSEPGQFLHFLNSPLVVHHAKDDGEVPYIWSELLATKLARHNKTYTFYSYESDKHFFKDEFQAIAVARDIRFFRSLMNELAE